MLVELDKLSEDNFHWDCNSFGIDYFKLTNGLTKEQVEALIKQGAIIERLTWWYNEMKWHKGNKITNADGTTDEDPLSDLIIDIETILGVNNSSPKESLKDE